MDDIINGTEISRIIKDEIKQEVMKLKNKPTLAVVIVGNNPASEIYVRNKKTACEYVGISSKVISLDENTTEDELISLIDKLNNDKDINGILVQLPLPVHINTANIILKIDPLKDVDGFHPYNIGMLFTNNTSLSPCTPKGCIELLQRSGVEIEGSNAVVIGRSNIVGKPVAMMLTNHNATTTLAHSKTQNLEKICKSADIIVCCIGIPNFLKSDMIKEDVVLIDVGINRLDNGKICGDIDFSCKDKARLITPVPGGVGPMTIAMLMKNCLHAYNLQNRI